MLEYQIMFGRDVAQVKKIQRIIIIKFTNLKEQVSSLLMKKVQKKIQS